MKRQGFTLVELLSVIIILAIIALIATPLILNAIEKAKQGAFKNTAYRIIKAIEFEHLQRTLEGNNEQLTFNYSNGVESNDDGLSLKYSGKKPKSGSVTINTSGKVALALSDGTYCVVKGYYDEDVVFDFEKDEETCFLEEVDLAWKDLSGAMRPELSSGMIPIVWDESENRWEKADVTQEWYNYNEKKWANVVLVTNESRSGYQEANPGTEILESDVLAYLVWIPRYRYQLFNVESGEIEPQLVKIKFEDKTTPKSTGNQNGQWLTHPAFTFGDQELSGIWVGKFETSTHTSSVCYTNPSVVNCDDTNQNPRIKPNVRSLRHQKLSNQFLTAQKISNTGDYGLSSVNDAHVMKNTEWGAVAYLTISQYGQGLDELYVNNSGHYITGCAGSSINAAVYTGSSITGCEDDNTYNTSNGQKASTTGNIYGIYDMAGGAWEWVMGAMKNSNDIVCSGYDSTYNSGFNGPYCNGSGSHTEGVEFPDPKYYDAYNYSPTNSNYNHRILGDATGEVLGWNGDYNNFVGLDDVWFARGGHNTTMDIAGILAFNAGNGPAVLLDSFRIVVIGDV